MSMDYLALKVLKIECDLPSTVTDAIMTNGLSELPLERFQLKGRAFAASLLFFEEFRNSFLLFYPRIV
jgi:hypothetical protein